MIVECNFYFKDSESVLEVCDKYPDDAMPETLYGRPLAHFQLGKKEEAKEAMKAAIELLPLVAQELVKKSHRKPKCWVPERVTVGGADEAYDYWERSGKYWKETKGAIEFVKECLEESANLLR